MAKTATTNPVPEPEDDGSGLPQWLVEGVVEPYSAGLASAFIVHGETNCLVRNPDDDATTNPYIPLRQLLEKFVSELNLVVFYNIAGGLGFLTPAMAEQFKRLNGVNDAPAGGGDPIAQARAALAAKRGLPTDPASCLPMLEKALREGKRTAVIVNYAHNIAPEATGSVAVAMDDRVNVARLRSWGQSQTFRKNRNLVLLLTDLNTKMSQELRGLDSEIRSVAIPKPADDERLRYIVTMTSGARAEFRLPPDCDAAMFSRAAQGLSLRQIYEVLVAAKSAGQPADLTFLKATKRNILNAEYGEVLTVLDAKRGLEDIGGHEHIKAYFRSILANIQSGEDRLVPMGVTMAGPPGTGKTAFVEALAHDAGFNCVSLKSLRSMWVGQSEARQELVLRALRSLAPVVVMNDEADLAEAQRDAPKGDSGVSERLMKGWMEFLSDPRNRGRIVVINCTNRPDRLDAALKRSGRSDTRILVPMPADDEIPAIYQVMFVRHGISNEVDCQRFTQLSKQKCLSGADIEVVVRKSLDFMQRRGGSKVSNEDVEASICDFIPSANQAAIDEMTMASLLECSSMELLPRNVSEIVNGICDRGLVPDLETKITSLIQRGIIKPRS